MRPSFWNHWGDCVRNVPVDHLISDACAAATMSAFCDVRVMKMQNSQHTRFGPAAEDAGAVSMLPRTDLKWLSDRDRCSASMVPMLVAS
jgi:hypothetical protein